jgi:VanZ family protein
LFRPREFTVLNRHPRHPSNDVRLALVIPLTTLVLAFTAIPMELRPRPVTWSALFDTRPEVYDVAVNVLGYLPLGAVLATRTVWSAAGIAAAVSGFAETTQLFTPGRAPSLLDLATNMLGALIGWALARRRQMPAARVGVTPGRALVASLLALACFGLVSLITPRELEDLVTSAARTLTVLGLPVNDRGATAPGALEAHWTFDAMRESEQSRRNDIVVDASGNGVDGVLANEPALVPGISGRALHLNGTNQYADFRSPASLRLTGSMTVSAWINASSFPTSDAVIVSDYGGLGYQLDTTVDQGPRTVAFRFTNAWGTLTSRYGATPLRTDAWYHVAGVFDADARSLTVFLNGRPDNGCLTGTVTSRQTVSPDHIYVGRPARPEGFAFAGSIDDVRIHSRALSEREIQEEMKMAGGRPNAAPGRGPHSRDADTSCRSSEPADPRAAGFVVAAGLFVAVACVGGWPGRNYRGAGLTLSLLAGLLMAPAVAFRVPAFRVWSIPLLTLAGAVAVMLSIRSTEADTSTSRDP